MSYLRAVLIAVDQLVNALLGGWPDETLSSAAYRRSLAGKPRLRNFLDWLFDLFGDSCHCEEAYLSERYGRQLPPELRPDIRQN